MSGRSQAWWAREAAEAAADGDDNPRRRLFDDNPSIFGDTPPDSKGTSHGTRRMYGRDSDGSRTQANVQRNIERYGDERFRNFNEMVPGGWKRSDLNEAQYELIQAEKAGNTQRAKELRDKIWRRWEDQRDPARVHYNHRFEEQMGPHVETTTPAKPKLKRGLDTRPFLPKEELRNIESDEQVKKRERSSKRKPVYGGKRQRTDLFDELDLAEAADKERLGLDQADSDAEVEEGEEGEVEDGKDAALVEKEEAASKLLYAQPRKKYIDLFQPRLKGAGQFFIFVGKSERGKTHALKHLLYHNCSRELAPYQYGVIFMGSKFKHSYKFHELSKPYVRIYEGFLLETLKAHIRNLEIRFEKYGYVEPNFVVFDDLVGIMSNAGEWFQNWIARYRHLNTDLFGAVQYLTGHNAISPVMREQATAVVMFNSKTEITQKNLYSAFGTLFPSFKSFQAHFHRMTDNDMRKTKHAAMVYFEWQDDIRKNYMSWLSPAKLPDGKVILKGPDNREGKDIQERRDLVAKALDLPRPFFHMVPRHLQGTAAGLKMVQTKMKQYHKKFQGEKFNYGGADRNPGMTRTMYKRIVKELYALQKQVPDDPDGLVKYKVSKFAGQTHVVRQSLFPSLAAPTRDFRAGPDQMGDPVEFPVVSGYY
jgi:hypothetical protein